MGVARPMLGILRAYVAPCPSYTFRSDDTSSSIPFSLGGTGTFQNNRDLKASVPTRMIVPCRLFAYSHYTGRIMSTARKSVLPWASASSYFWYELPVIEPSRHYLHGIHVARSEFYELLIRGRLVCGHQFPRRRPRHYTASKTMMRYLLTTLIAIVHCCFCSI